MTPGLVNVLVVDTEWIVFAKILWKWAALAHEAPLPAGVGFIPILRPDENVSVGTLGDRDGTLTAHAPEEHRFLKDVFSLLMKMSFKDYLSAEMTQEGKSVYLCFASLLPVLILIVCPKT